MTKTALKCKKLEKIFVSFRKEVKWLWVCFPGFSATWLHQIVITETLKCQLYWLEVLPKRKKRQNNRVILFTENVPEENQAKWCS